ncbi:MAG: 3'-5' exonuclease, partial [Opitutaceae bacterium]
MQTTRGLAEVLRSYETVYHDAVRRAGKLGFDDVRRLLEPGGGALTLTRDAEASGRMFIDYRLDGEIDHWLLDEFQDTSFGQWSVLRSLIDEAVQDPERKRTFFYVGDVKQAIFGWRGGDARLFREIFSHYNAVAPDTIIERHLVESWRSGPAVVEMANAVFGHAAGLDELFSPTVSAQWNREWRAHRSAVTDRTGQAAWLHAEDADARYGLTLELIREIDPLARGLTCAVLVRDNGTAAEIAERLRAGGVAAVAESDLRVCTDNPAGTALLALFQAAAHPGDTFAQEHVRMTPLGGVLATEGVEPPEKLTARVLSQIHSDGFERAAEFWARKLEPRLAANDEFSRLRLRQFVRAAGAFDAMGSRDVAEFIAFMQNTTVRDTESAAIVRVMTIHKAKGLGFDVVILPDLEGRKLEQRRDGLAVLRAPDRSVEWVLDLPPKLFCDSDAVLTAYVNTAESEAGYENLSLLYVAMTRAKRAMYVLTKWPGASESRNFPKLLTTTLGTQAQEVRIGRRSFAASWSCGDPAWHQAVEMPAFPARIAGEIEPFVSTRAQRANRLAARRPSGEKSGAVGAAQLFTLEGGAAAEFGTRVHELLATVAWAAPADLARLAREWRTHGEAGVEALACLQATELKSVWRQREGAEVWRERTFEIVLDGVWVTGVFDRVVV